MLPLGNQNISGKEKKLLQQFRKLDEQQQKTLQSFAEFLVSQDESAEQVPAEIPEPVDIARPQEESVVKAIKRLTATYPMLEKDKILNQISALMAQHVMQGRPAVDVIDELETIFKLQYEKLLSADD